MSIARFGLGAAGAIALWAGMALGSTGCLRCPDVEPLEPGTYEIVESNLRPELVGGMLVADPNEGVEISYALEDGSDWVIQYELDVRVPEDG